MQVASFMSSSLVSSLVLLMELLYSLLPDGCTVVAHVMSRNAAQEHCELLLT